MSDLWERPRGDRLDREELREWLDRKPPERLVCLVHGTEFCAHDEPESTEADVSGHDVHESGCNCADCAGDSF